MFIDVGLAFLVGILQDSDNSLISDFQARVNGEFRFPASTQLFSLIVPVLVD